MPKVCNGVRHVQILVASPSGCGVVFVVVCVATVTSKLVTASPDKSGCNFVMKTVGTISLLHPEWVLRIIYSRRACPEFIREN